MRSRAATIFVEGDSDLRFIQQYLKHCSAFEKVEGIPISKLHGNTTALSSDGGKLLIKEALTNSEKTLVLLGRFNSHIPIKHGNALILGSKTSPKTKHSTRSRSV